ncbi:uncharacterized protein LOC125738694 [Brienomyrus brachyistius]|uniref:uncharacterized protein LOC125738694 n=1 Tax=Brienomyrus brachyistius TaxID=42636 RepID=UPI0020B2A6F8|nr:uncharacterized protein LOC125738694 [Brienomyrus brachyistius]
MAHVTYNISNLLPLDLKHCNGEDKMYTWLQTRLEDLVSDNKSRLAIQVLHKRLKRDLIADITGLFGSGYSIINSYRIARQSQYTTWVANQVATGFKHLSNSNENLIKAVKSEAQTLRTISAALFNQTQFHERDVACRTYAQDLFTARQEILDLRLKKKTPRHALNDLIGKLELEKWLKSYIRGTLKYSELLTFLMMHTGTKCMALKKIASVMDSPDVRRGDAAAFERFVLQVQSLVGMLKTLGPEGEAELQCRSQVARLLSKLPPEQRAEFRRCVFRRSGTDYTLTDLSDWLKYESWCQDVDGQLPSKGTKDRPVFKGDRQSNKRLATVLHGAKDSLGWTLQGPAKLVRQLIQPQQCLMTSVAPQVNELMNHIERLWQLDTIPFRSEKLVTRSKQDLEAISILKSKTTRVELNGILRYATPLLRRKNMPRLQAPMEAVMPSLGSIERRLSRDPEKATAYKEEMEKLIKAGRFIARRGTPAELFSDQGTNFRGGERELREAFVALSSDLQQHLAKQKILFHFNPPAAPHFGGVWEREIRSIKAALITTVGAQPVPEEVLRTALIEVEAILNSKPLGYVPSDVNDLDPKSDPATWDSDRNSSLHFSCTGFFVTFSLSNPGQVWPNSTTIRSLGTIVKDQVIKWDHRMGCMTLKGTETLVNTRACCHETTHIISFAPATLQPFSHNDTKLINIHSLHGHAEAVQVSHTQWCVVSEMDSFIYEGLTCPANHTFCLEVTDDFTMGHINILGRVPLDVDVSPWWDDTFYDEDTRTMTETMDLVQQVILQIDYHLHQAHNNNRLTKKTVHILTSASTHSAQYICLWWDWMFRICVIASGFIFIITRLQFCYLRHHIKILKTSTKNAFIPSPLQVQPVQRLETSGT